MDIIKCKKYGLIKHIKSTFNDQQKIDINMADGPEDWEEENRTTVFSFKMGIWENYMESAKQNV